MTDARGLEEFNVSAPIETLVAICLNLWHYMPDQDFIRAAAPSLRKLRVHNLDAKPSNEQLSEARLRVTEIISFRWGRTEIGNVDPLEELEISEELVVPGFAYFPDGDGKLTLIPSEQ